jgi:hypothetical protein
LASELATCLAVNSTRTIDCMSKSGFANIPTGCADCLFSAAYVTDGACQSVCSARPSSGRCRQCVNAFVTNTMIRCFGLPSFNMPFEPACSDDDMELIGPDNMNINSFLKKCTDSVSCEYDNVGFAVGGNGVISDKCLDCMYVGEGRSDGSCDDYCASVTTDCGYSPLQATYYSKLVNADYPCTIEDLAIFDHRSRLQDSIHDCLYNSNHTALGISQCLGVAGPQPAIQKFSDTCRLCMSNEVEILPSCVSTCSSYGLKSTACQDCVGNVKKDSFMTCFASSGTSQCSLTEASMIAYESWALTVLQRCLLDTGFSDIKTCFAKSELDNIDLSFECNVCMTQYLERGVACAPSCKTNPGSQDCRLCSTTAVTDMLKKCMQNPKLNPDNRNDAIQVTLDGHRPSGQIPIIITFLLSVAMQTN